MAAPGTPLLIGNCSGFYGDRLSALREMVTGGPLDVVTGDYLAELTMLILFRSRAKDPTKGYATTFLRQLEDTLGECLSRGVKVVVNAGGLNPAACAEAVRTLAARLGLDAAVAHVEGDDLLPRVDELRPGLAHLDTGAPLTGSPLTANAYLGAFGITECLRAGADVVVTGRVTDASLVVGPAAWHHGWTPASLTEIAGAMATGHVLECGPQATGGNYSFFGEVPGVEHLGFPLAEVHADGSSVITKHPGTGGLVSLGTVTAQLLYEIGSPAYLGPDAVADFSTLTLTEDGPDRVRLSGVAAGPPPSSTKVCLNLVGGLRNSVTFLLTGLDVDAKAALVQRQLAPVLSAADSADVRLERTTAADPSDNAEAVSRLVLTVKGTDPKVVGRAFSSACVELALASYPGLTMTAPPGDATPYGVYWPALVPSTEVPHVAVLPDGTRVDVPPPPAASPEASPAPVAPGAPEDPTPPDVAVEVAETRRVPLGVLVGARSGDKGGTANLGVWARSDAAYEWLTGFLTVDRLTALLPEAAGLDVRRYPLANLRALNFTLPGLLGEGVSSSPRLDPQAKGLGEWLRARLVDVPAALLD